MSYAPSQIAAGSVVGPYVVERKLAQGGMGILFLAHDTKLDRSVALKVIPEEASTPVTRARLLREARTLAAVEHPGIVRVYGAGEQDGAPWIAMELLRGTDLKRLLSERGPVPPFRALRWIVQAAEALSAAHDVGVVHRDLKPSNLLLTHDDVVKIVDFGIAKRRTDSHAADLATVTPTSQPDVLGTPAYLSPEQLEHGLADERSDIWSLGCVLFELCVGVPPFGRASAATTSAAILRDEPVYPSSLPGPVVDVISACLRKSSFARIGSMRELVALARDALDTIGGPQSALPSDRSLDRERSADRTSRFPASRASSSVAPFSAAAVEPPSRGALRASVMSRSSARPSSPPTPPSFTARGSSIPGFPSASSSSSFAAAAPARGRMKGTAIRAAVLWFAQVYGETRLARVHELGSPELRAIVRLDDPAFGIVASAWYDTHTIGELLTLMERVSDTDDSDGYHEALASAIAKDNVTGVYRSLFRLITTPRMLEANAQRVWRTYCDEGVMNVRAGRPGELQLELHAWTRHHPQTCRLVAFAIQHVLREVGYEGLVIDRSQCVSDGHPCCAFEGLYLPRRAEINP